MKAFSGAPCLIFPSARPITEPERLIRALEVFSQGWQSHGAPVQSRFTVLENRFLVVAHRPGEISGCGRDDLIAFVRNLPRSVGMEWAEDSWIYYREGERIESVDRAEFKRRVVEGRITPDTGVFDTTLRGVDDLLAGKFVLPAGRCWHGKLIASARMAVPTA